MGLDMHACSMAHCVHAALRTRCTCRLCPADSQARALALIPPRRLPRVWVAAAQPLAGRAPGRISRAPSGVGGVLVHGPWTSPPGGMASRPARSHIVLHPALPASAGIHMHWRWGTVSNLVPDAKLLQWPVDAQLRPKMVACIRQRMQPLAKQGLQASPAFVVKVAQQLGDALGRCWAAAGTPRPFTDGRPVKGELWVGWGGRVGWVGVWGKTRRRLRKPAAFPATQVCELLVYHSIPPHPAVPQALPRPCSTPSPAETSPMDLQTPLVAATRCGCVPRAACPVAPC